ncbi:hypothetical protein HYU23_02950 [Candidatus Woesearchaeota archaeon]|nr:hypothetical protein [Candidatus Woesearchaeota archaeon]
MIIKLLAFADTLSILALIGSSLLPQKIVLLMAIYLIIKGLAFILIGGLFPNFLDMLSGFYLIIVLFGISHWIITIAVIIFLGQKAFFSLI